MCAGADATWQWPASAQRRERIEPNVEDFVRPPILKRIGVSLSLIEIYPRIVAANHRLFATGDGDEILKRCVLRGKPNQTNDPIHQPHPPGTREGLQS